jgi:hypothetical protein
MKTLLWAALVLSAASRDDLASRAAAVKPSAKELTWLAVPWVTDLAEARKTAEAEKRPLFVWATGDDPLERC